MKNKVLAVFVVLAVAILATFFLTQRYYQSKAVASKPTATTVKVATEQKPVTRTDSNVYTIIPVPELGYQPRNKPFNPTNQSTASTSTSK